MNSETNMNSTPSEFKTQLNNVVQEYLKLKDALVESNPSAVTSSAKEIQKALSTVDMSLVKGDMHVSWMNHLNQMNNTLSILASSSTLDAQRTAFLSLSNTLIESVKTFGLPGVIYQQFCPMTDSGKGGYWLSESEEIANPYFGDQMHNCGETITKIES
jgi:Cu(I)/Ag(I) efflux system membrane fusion protein